MPLECNIFKNVADLDCTNVVHIASVLKNIRNGRWKDKVEYVRGLMDKKAIQRAKNNLPCVTFCGVFDERIDDGCVLYNHLMIIDIDNISANKLKKLREDMKLNPWILSFFSGVTKGVKILILIDSEKEDHNTHAFEFIRNQFLDLYDVEIDASGKNLSRLCFVSYDPDLHINSSPEILHIEKYASNLNGFINVVKHDFGEGVPIYDASKIFDTCVKMVNKCRTGSYHKGNRNNFIFVLSCLMCSFGVSPENTISFINLRYKSLPVKEVNNTVMSAYKKNKHNFGTKTMNERNGTKQIDFFKFDK